MVELVKMKIINRRSAMKSWFFCFSGWQVGNIKAHIGLRHSRDMFIKPSWTTITNKIASSPCGFKGKKERLYAIILSDLRFIFFFKLIYLNFSDIKKKCFLEKSQKSIPRDGLSIWRGLKTCWIKRNRHFRPFFPIYFLEYHSSRIAFIVVSTCQRETIWMLGQVSK